MKNNNNKQEQQQQQLSRPRQVQQAHTRPFEENCPNQLPVLVCVCVNKYHWKEASILISLCDK